MANAFNAPLPNVGDKPWTLTPAVTEVRGRLAGVEDSVTALQGGIGADAGTLGPMFPSATEVTALGESTTANAGYETNLAAYTGLSITNAGVSGQGITDELVRVGAIQPRITIEGGVIPSGSFDILITAIDPAEGWRRTGSGSFTFGVIVNGLTCTLSNVLTNNTFRLSGTNSGGPVTVPPGTAIYRNPVNLTPTRRILFESLRNNVGTSLLRVREMLKKVENAQSSQIKEVLYVGIINGSSEGEGTANYDRIVAANARSQQEFGDRFFDIRRDFIDRGLTIRGITPTSGDLADIAADKPPRSLWETGGGIHPNADGYLVKNYLIAEKMLEIGWVSSLNLPAIPDPEPEPDPVTWTTWTSDSFNRANGAYGTSDAASGGTPQTPVSVDSQLGIISNQWGATASTSAERYFYFTPGNEAAVELDFLGGGRVVFRLSGNSGATEQYQFEAIPSGGSGIYRTVAGTKTAVATATTQPALNDRLRFEAAIVTGKMRLRAFKNGIMIAEYLDSSPLTGTRIGVGSPNSSSAYRIDNLVIQTRVTA